MYMKEILNKFKKGTTIEFCSKTVWNFSIYFRKSFIKKLWIWNKEYFKKKGLTQESVNRYIQEMKARKRNVEKLIQEYERGR